MQMIATGISFKNSPLYLREKISFSEIELKKAIVKLSLEDSVKEIVILSTCNRTEFYIIADNLSLAYETLIDFICNEKNLDKKQLEEYFYIFYNKFAAEHLYKVASGIDSLVFGETEILSQVKKAFITAQNNGATGKIFNSLFKSVIECGKRVRTETKISQGNTSFSSIILKIIKDKFVNLDKVNILLIGLGEIGITTAKNLKNIGVKNLTLTNRSLDKLINLSKELGTNYIKLEDLYKEINNFDVIITCTASGKYIITKKNFTPNKNTLLIDISIPRNIDPEIANNHSVTLYDMDLLQKEIDINIEERKKSLHSSQIIIEEEMNKFIQWYNNFDILPVISSLSNFFENIRQQEINKAINKFNLNDENLKILDMVTKSIVSKILHYPVTNLKTENDNIMKEQYLNDLKYLFQLDNQDNYNKYYRKTDNKKCPFSIKKI
ncbi:MAG: glutamyl-tRNA reductase [Candidatus Sericytochromatia bacterium]|nr:MAG: glutamyl-tRNA reductase [Candidatus Sericytochromatia bacterium]